MPSFSTKDLKEFDDAKISEQEKRFTGRIADAEIQGGNFGEQLRLSIEPTSFQAERPFYEYIKVSEYRGRGNKPSGWFAFLDALEKCGIHIVQENELIGLEFEWVTDTRHYKFTDKDTGEEKEGNKKFRLPVALVKQGEKVAGKKSSKKAEEPPAAPAPADPDPKEYLLAAIEKHKAMSVDTLMDLGKERYGKVKLKKALDELVADKKLIIEDSYYTLP